MRNSPLVQGTFYMRFAKSLVGHNSRTEFIKAFKVLLSILKAAAKISGLGFVGVFASAAEGAVNGAIT